MDDFELLQEYAEHRSEQAFAQLVNRHLNLVYSTALRVTGKAHLAQDTAQLVFITLARKARSLRRGTAPSGWLYRTAWFEATRLLRAEGRRQKRERNAMETAAAAASGESVWNTVAPYLDEAMHQLGSRDQDALVLRYFKGHSLREVGHILGLSEDAAQKRVSRALGKLRKLLTDQGLPVPVALLAPAMVAHAVQAAPAGLAATVVNTALAQAAAPAGLTLLYSMAKSLTHLQTAALTALVGLVPIGFQAYHLNELRAEQGDLASQLVQAQRTLAELQDQETGLQRRLVQRENAQRRAQAQALVQTQPNPPTAAAPPESSLPPFLRVSKELVTQSKLGTVSRRWQLTPLLVEALGMRSEEVTAVNQALAGFVTDVQILQETRLSTTAERAWGVMPKSAENLAREFKSFELSVCTNQMALLHTNLAASLEWMLGPERAGLLLRGSEYSLQEAALLRGEAGLLTLLRPADPKKGVIANVTLRTGRRGRSTMLIEGWSLTTLPTSIRQVVEDWWNLEDLDRR